MDYLERTKQGTSFAGSDVRIFQAYTVATGLAFYAKFGIPINRAYTPTNMLRVAHELTGKRFNRAQMLAAADALREWAEAVKAAPRTV